MKMNLYKINDQSVIVYNGDYLQECGVFHKTAFSSHIETTKNLNEVSINYQNIKKVLNNFSKFFEEYLYFSYTDGINEIFISIKELKSFLNINQK